MHNQTHESRLTHTLGTAETRVQAQEKRLEKTPQELQGNPRPTHPHPRTTWKNEAKKAVKKHA